MKGSPAGPVMTEPDLNNESFRLSLPHACTWRRNIDVASLLAASAILTYNTLRSYTHFTQHQSGQVSEKATTCVPDFAERCFNFMFTKTVQGSRVLQKLTVAQMVKIFQVFMGPENQLVSRVCVTYKMDFWIWWLDLLHFIHSHSSGLQAIQRYRWSTHFPVHRYTRTRVLSLH
jgi:hypothetical protein